MSQKLHWMISETAGIFVGREISEIIAREGHIKRKLALCFQPIRTLGITKHETIELYNNIQRTAGPCQV